MAWHRRLAPIVALSLVLAVGCTVGEGPVVGELRHVGPFDRIEVSAGIHLEAEVGELATVEVRAQSNLLDAIATEVRGGTLTIEAVDNITSTEPVTVIVVTPGVAGVSLSGGAQASVQGLDESAIEVEAHGGSRVTLVGSVGEVELRADGGSIADLGQLAARSVALRLDGAADATVRAAEEVTGTVSGGSQLRVIGDAQVTVEASGGGQVARE